MGRIHTSNNDNSWGFSYNFSVAKPMDTRLVVASYNDLTTASTWLQGTEYMNYKGMAVTCVDTGKIYVYIGESGSATDVANADKWVAQGTAGGKGIEIVSSVDELDPDAPQGSLTSVAVNTVNEVNFSELYQPTSDEVNVETGVIDTTNLSRVSGISVNSSFDTSAEIVPFYLYLFSKYIDTIGNFGQLIDLGIGGCVIMDFTTLEEQELELFIPNDDGTITVNEENLAIVNNLLSSTEFVYGGVEWENGDNMELSYHPCVDMFYKIVDVTQKTDLYIKDIDGWKVLEDNIKKEMSSLNFKVNKFQFDLTNLKNTMDNIEDKTDLIVNSVDELPGDAPIGKLASVLHDELIEFKISEDVYPNKAIDKFVFRIPEKIEDTTLLTGNTTLLEVKSNIFLYTVRIMFTNGSSLDGSNSSYAALWYGSGSSDSILLANYDLESGDLVYYDETKATNLASSIISYNSASSTICNTKYVDTFMYVMRNSKCTSIYAKNEIGWEEIKTEADLNGNNFVSEDRLAEALKNFEDSLEGLGVSGLTVDADKGWLRATGQDTSGNTKNYFIALTELSKPNAPTIAEANRTKSVVTGSTSISVTNNTSESTMYYSVDDGVSWSTTSGTVNIDSGFANNKDNTTKTQSLWVKAIKNGEESDINKYTITITPKVSTPTISVSNSNTYGTSASITINLSATKGATTYYKEDDGDWIKLDSSKTIEYTTTENTPMSVTSGKFKAYATKTEYNYDNSETSSSNSISLGNKHAYYGFSTKSTLEDREDIIALATSGGKLAKTSIEPSSETSQKVYTIYPKKKDQYSFVGSDVYIWVCIAGTLRPDKIYDTWNNIANMGFNNAIQVDDWNCYRLENFISITDSTSDLTILLKS